jgi:hypothetical protein
MDPTKEQHQISCSLKESVMDTLQMIRQAFGEESMKHTRKVQIHRDRKKARLVKSKVKEHAHHFL